MTNAGTALGEHRARRRELGEHLALPGRKGVRAGARGGSCDVRDRVLRPSRSTRRNCEAVTMTDFQLTGEKTRFSTNPEKRFASPRLPLRLRAVPGVTLRRATGEDRTRSERDGRSLPGRGTRSERVRKLRCHRGPRAVFAMPHRALLLPQVPEGVLAVSPGVVPPQRLRGRGRAHAAQVREVPAEAREAGRAKRRCVRAAPRRTTRAEEPARSRHRTSRRFVPGFFFHHTRVRERRFSRRPRRR